MVGFLMDMGTNLGSTRKQTQCTILPKLKMPGIQLGPRTRTNEGWPFLASRCGKSVKFVPIPIAFYFKNSVNYHIS